MARQRAPAPRQLPARAVCTAPARAAGGEVSGGAGEWRLLCLGNALLCGPSLGFRLYVVAALIIPFSDPETGAAGQRL